MSKLKILAISDIHCTPFTVPDSAYKADILIVAGDLTNWGKLAEFETTIDILFEMSFTYAIGRILVTGGNHDNLLENDLGRQAIEEYARKKSEKTGIKFIVALDECIELEEGIKIWMSPYYRPIGSIFGFYYTPEMETDLFKRIPEDIDVLVTHGPALGLLDKSEDEEELGSLKLLEWITLNQPYIHIFGHIHEQGGKKMSVNQRHFYNVATVAQVIEMEY